MRVRVMVFNTNATIISAISWQSIVLMEETSIQRKPRADQLCLYVAGVFWKCCWRISMELKWYRHMLLVQTYVIGTDICYWYRHMLLVQIFVIGTIHWKTIHAKIKYQNRRSGKIETTDTYMHDHSLSWLGINTSIKKKWRC